jgi:hypothetical protein
MKKQIGLLLLLLHTLLLSAQVNTIKVSKNKADTTTAVKKNAFKGFFVYYRLTYMLNTKKEYNADIGIGFPVGHGFNMGIEYSDIWRKYDATGYNQQTGQTSLFKKNTDVYATYLRIPFSFRYPLGARSVFAVGIAPGYMLTERNDDKLLARSDFYLMNLSYFGSVGRFFTIGRKRKLRYYWALWFSGDVQPNLKTEEVHDSNGTFLYNQRSRTYQIGLETFLGIR